MYGNKLPDSWVNPAVDDSYCAHSTMEVGVKPDSYGHDSCPLTRADDHGDVINGGTTWKIYDLEDLRWAVPPSPPPRPPPPRPPPPSPPPPLPIDCDWYWNSWSACPTCQASECGNKDGFKTRSKVIRSQAQFGGEACNANLDTQACTTYCGSCACDGNWNGWGVCENVSCNNCDQKSRSCLYRSTRNRVWSGESTNCVKPPRPSGEACQLSCPYKCYGPACMG